MCGIAGFFDASGELLEERGRAMGKTQRHRGPDDCQVWWDRRAGLVFAHTRLAIIDLSEAGRQPMSTPDGRFTIVYNGEIYNHRMLSDRLQAEGCRFRGRSDTEVLLRAIEQWGVERALSGAIGMFAFGLWDAHERALTLARDRLGIKPLYYGWSAGRFYFASELKAIEAHPQFRAEISPQAVSFLAQYGYIPAPMSIYNGVLKLMPGTALTLSMEALAGRVTTEPRAYWSLERLPTENQGPISDDEALTELDRLLESSVRYRLIADVPVGAFLSGGVDSSIVVAIMAKVASNKVNTFSIAFDEAGYNEASHARRVADRLQTEHVELRVTSGDALAVVNSLPRIFDEPFADASQIPTYLVSKLARDHVTVALTGDGGDELFAGYNRHVWSQAVGTWSRALPPLVRGALARALARPSPSRVLALAMRLLPRSLRMDRPDERVEKLAAVLDASSPADLYLISQQNFGRHAHPVSLWSVEALPGVERFEPGGDFLRWAMLVDLATYLPDDLLCKVDRASMASSLEARVPLLDHRIVEYSASLPSRMKVRHGRRKWLLRQLLARHLPEEWFDRPKMGFSVPVGRWLRKELREWAEDLLAPTALEDSGWFEPAIVRRVWFEHSSGQRNHQQALWSVLMFQQWYRDPSRRRSSEVGGGSAAQFRPETTGSR